MASIDTICVAVSGGRDSLLALALTVEQARERGGSVLALHALLRQERPGDAKSRAALAQACRSLDAELHVVDLRGRFEELVVRPFVADYLAGRTPNPCARCNAAVKFGLLLDAARRLGANTLATGHYARLEDHPLHGRVLRRGADAAKDQSYFLALVRRERLARAFFPLGGWRKADVLPALAARGLTPPESAESQDVCFVDGDDYAGFIAAHAAAHGLSLPGPGPILLEDGREIGRHAGLWRHTPGQRRGLGVAWSEPLYVLARDAARNALVVGPRAALDAPGCVAEEVNALMDPARWPEVVLVKTRYRQAAGPVRWALEGDALRLAFLSPQGRPAPGQVAALYDHRGALLGGGVIAGEE